MASCIEKKAKALGGVCWRDGLKSWDIRLTVMQGHCQKECDDTIVGLWKEGKQLEHHRSMHRVV